MLRLEFFVFPNYSGAKTGIPLPPMCAEGMYRKGSAMSFPALDLLIGSLGVIVHACLLATIIIRSRWRTYPFFTLFVVFQNLYSPSLYVAYHFNRDTYNIVFWVFEAVLFLIELVVAGEMFVAIWKRGGSLKSVPWQRFALWSGVSLLVAASSSSLVGTAFMPEFDLYAMRGSIFTSFLLSGVFVGFSLESNRLRLRRPKHPMIIGWGLTGIAMLELSEDLRFYTHGWHWSSDTSDHIRQVLYACIVLYWTIGLWRQDSLSWPRAGVSLPARKVG